MTNPNDPIHPTIIDLNPTSHLTKREYFAAMAMQGLLAGSEGQVSWTENQFSIGAVNLADALIAELNKKEPS